MSRDSKQESQVCRKDEKRPAFLAIIKKKIKSTVKSYCCFQPRICNHTGFTLLQGTIKNRDRSWEVTQW
jgi:hypothetical protein